MSFPLGKNIPLLTFRILEYSYSFLNLTQKKFKLKKKNWKRKKENCVEFIRSKVWDKENLQQQDAIILINETARTETKLGYQAQLGLSPVLTYSIELLIFLRQLLTHKQRRQPQCSPPPSTRPLSLASIISRMWNVPHRLMDFNTWSPVGGTILGHRNLQKVEPSCRKWVTRGGGT